MGSRKRRGMNPDMIRFENLTQLCNAANNLAQDFAEDPETVAYLQEIRDWAIKKLVNELE